jgi:hypothetical protein
MQEERYSFQVKLENVEFAFDEEAASALELDLEMSAVERAECYLRERVLSPVRFAESDGTRHQVLEWDPAPVAYSGCMGCVTHSIVVTTSSQWEAHSNSGLISFAVVKLQVNRPAYRPDCTAQSPVSDLYGNIRVEQVIVSAYNDTETMLRVNHHYALKVNMLSPLPQRVTLLAVLDAWT